MHNVTRALLTLAVVLAGLPALAQDAPTDNPLATFYGDAGHPAWTDAIQWQNVINMKTYAKGKTQFEKFENARDELAAKGGGVLYYPAGVYEFNEGPFDGPQGRGLMLKSGVVIRGDAPAGKPCAAKDGTLDLKTRLQFGFQQKTVTVDGVSTNVSVPRDWNIIGLLPDAGKGVKDVDRVGVCWVHLDGAVIYWGPQLTWGPSWKEGKSWKSKYAKGVWADRKPDGTHPIDPFMGAPNEKEGGKYEGAGKGRLVFGCTLTRAAFLNDYDTCGRPESPNGFGTNGFHMAKFAGRISAYGSRVFIANNCLAISTNGNFRYEQTTVQNAPGKGGNDFKILGTRTSTIMWDYGRTMGIDVNKDMVAMAQGSVLKAETGGYFEEGVAVIDNWVWNHGHKGYNLSGKWATVHGNRNERVFQKGGDDVYGVGGNWRLTLDGFIESNAGGGGMISDNLSRAFDMGGWNVSINGNSYGNTGSNPGNDGEGILCQAHGGTPIWSWTITHNRNEGSVGGNGKGMMLGWAVDALGFLAGWNQSKGGQIGLLYRKGNQIADVAIVKNDGPISPGPNNPKADSAADGTGTPIYEAAGIPKPPTDVKAEGMTDAVQITWTDASDNEVGFRVERSLDAGKTWRTIAYRPPHREGSAKNPQVWMDFLAPSGRPIVYRVVALDMEDGDAGASAPAAPVTLPKPQA